MSLRVKHLNADTSFLLIFSPPGAPHNPQGTFPGSFTILIDPWLSGPSTVWNPHFALTTHVIPACVESIKDIPDPDLVIVSQDKPDHCHAETLLQLPSDTEALIAGPAAAAKKIRSWKHFDPSAICALSRYEENAQDSVLRIAIPPISPSGQAGEVTVALLAPKRELTGLHNAIAVTYRPPSSVLSSSKPTYITLPPTPPMTPPRSPANSSSRSTSSPASSRRPSSSHHHRPGTPGRPITPGTTTKSTTLASNPHSATSSIAPLSSSSSSSSSTSQPHPTHHTQREKTTSVLYTPHGLPYAHVHAFATTHLLSEAALPLSCLFHSFDRTSNPWYLGGNISAGAPGGVEIARNLYARYWVSAHDEDKDNTGWSTRGLKTTRVGAEELRTALQGGTDDCVGMRSSASSESGSGSGSRSGSGSIFGKSRSTSGGVVGGMKNNTQVVDMDAGEELVIPIK